MTLQAILPMYVIILNWNLPEETTLCIESVQAHQPSGVEIVVVDNGSTDHSVQMLQKRFGNGIKIVETGLNLGFAGGVNVGVQTALAKGAQSVLLLNNDTIVAPDMIQHLVAAANQAPQAGIVGPVIYYFDDPQRIWSLGAREVRWLPVPLALSTRALARANSEPFQLDYGNACGMLIRRQVFETIGLFDTRYFFYFEDVDFCHRARQAGYEVWCVPQAKMWHKVSLTVIKQKLGMRYTEWWGRAQFYRTHPHGFLRALTHAYLLAKLVKKSLHDLLARDWDLLQALWAGTRDGYLGRPSRHADFFS